MQRRHRRCPVTGEVGQRAQQVSLRRCGAFPPGAIKAVADLTASVAHSHLNAVRADGVLIALSHTCLPIDCRRIAVGHVPGIHNVTCLDYFPSWTAGVLASLAEVELELGRERRSAAREARRARGQSISRPRALTDEKVALARRMHASTIADTLGHRAHTSFHGTPTTDCTIGARSFRSPTKARPTG
jgi:hypothetical protein